MLRELWWLVASRLTDSARGALSDDVDDASANNCQLEEYRGSETFRQRVSMESDAILCFAWIVLSVWKVTTLKGLSHHISYAGTVHHRGASLQISLSRQSFYTNVPSTRKVVTIHHHSRVCLSIRLPEKDVVGDGCQLEALSGSARRREVVLRMPLNSIILGQRPNFQRSTATLQYVAL